MTLNNNPIKEITYLSSHELPWATIRLRSDGIMEFNFNHEHIVSIANVKEIERVVEILGNGKRYPNLVISGKFTSMEHDVRKYMASEEANRFTIADAFVIHSLAQKIAGNFYLLFDKPPRPTMVFTKVEEAVKWLKGF